MIGLPLSGGGRHQTGHTELAQFFHEGIDRQSACRRVAIDDEADVMTHQRGGGHDRPRFRGGRRGRCRVAGEGAQARAGRFDHGRIGFALALVGGQHVLEHIAGVEEGIDHFLAQPEFVLADTVEQILQHMGDIGHVGESEGSGGALDRVSGAENRVQLLVVGITDVEPQQQGLHAGQMLAGFLEENLIELTQIDRHVSLPDPWVVTGGLSRSLS